MKLIFMIIQDSDASKLMDKLIENNIGATRISTSGGFLRRGNTSLIVGVEEEMLEKTLDIVNECCQKRIKYTMPVSAISEAYLMGSPVEVQVGGATCFIMDCECRKF